MAFDFTPLLQSWSSTAAFFAFSAAVFAFADSAFLVGELDEEFREGRLHTFALPATFLEFSPACFFGILAIETRVYLRDWISYKMRICDSTWEVFIT